MGAFVVLRYGGVPLLVLLFFSGAFALTLNLPSQVQQANPFLFSVRISTAGTFTVAQVFYDNKLITSFDNNGNASIDTSNGKFVISAFMDNETVLSGYVIYAEKSSGAHTVKAIAYNGSSLVGEETKQVTAVDTIAGSSEISALNARLSSLESSFNAIQSSVSRIDSNAGANSSLVSQMSAQLSDAVNEINSIKAVLSSTTNTGTVSIIQQKALQDRVASLEEKNKSLGDKILFLEAGIEQQKQKAEENNSQFPVFWIALPVVAVILLLAFVFLTKRKKGWGY